MDNLRQFDLQAWEVRLDALAAQVSLPLSDALSQRAAAELARALLLEIIAAAPEPGAASSLGRWQGRTSGGLVSLENVDDASLVSNDTVDWIHADLPGRRAWQIDFSPDLRIAAAQNGEVTSSFSFSAAGVHDDHDWQSIIQAAATEFNSSMPGLHSEQGLDSDWLAPVLSASAAAAGAVAAQAVRSVQPQAFPPPPPPPPAPSPKAPVFYLVVQPGGQTIMLNRSLSIGRGQDNDLRLDDLNLSRHHAVIEAAAHGWQVRDLGSTNGTRLNGKRISAPLLLQAGDVIELGDTRLTLELG